MSWPTIVICTIGALGSADGIAICRERGDITGERIGLVLLVGNIAFVLYFIACGLLGGVE